MTIKKVEVSFVWSSNHWCITPPKKLYITIHFLVKTFFKLSKPSFDDTFLQCNKPGFNTSLFCSQSNLENRLNQTCYMLRILTSFRVLGPSKVGQNKFLTIFGTFFLIFNQFLIFLNPKRRKTINDKIKLGHPQGVNQLL